MFKDYFVVALNMYYDVIVVCDYNVGDTLSCTYLVKKLICRLILAMYLFK